MIPARKGPIVALAVAAAALCGYAAYAQQGSGEKVGEKIGRKVDQAVGEVKRGAEKIGEGVREGFDRARDKVNDMGVEARVYGRLHWDKSLNRAVITLEMRDPSIVVLKGSVPDESARAKAVSLARETVGVTGVLDQLGLEKSSDTSAPGAPKSR